jgi:hypothetical protein
MTAVGETVMRKFRVEYLRESTEESSVSHKMQSSADTLENAIIDAELGFATVVGAIDGYQIKDASNGRIVFLHQL